MSYISRHPTHWNLRADIAAVANGLIYKHGGSWCTYRDHPEGWGLDYTSVDFWDFNPDAGDNYYLHRGMWLPRSQGQKIADEAFLMAGAPWIRWMIWQNWAWNAYRGWYYYGGSSYADMGHYGHIHITYW